MAGSRKWVLYEADNGEKYAVNIDESNAEAAEFEDISLLTDLVFTGGYPRLPQGMQMRYANCVADDGSTRKIYVGKPSSVGQIFLGVVRSLLLPTFQSGNNIGDAIAYLITSLVGERMRGSPISRDTGLIDGDAS